MTYAIIIVVLLALSIFAGLVTVGAAGIATGCCRRTSAIRRCSTSRGARSTS